MKPALHSFTRIFTLVVLFVLAASISTNAQTTNKSRIAVVANDTKTNIWVSDFPKKTSIIVTDEDNNLLSITSTNEFGAAYLTFPTGIKTSITVKTISGDIIASKKAAVKNKQEEQNVAANDTEFTNKA